MEHYSQQTSGWKPICITDVVIHGNVYDLSTKADEDPEINVCMPAPESQTLISSLFLDKAHEWPMGQIQCLQVSLALGSSRPSAGLRERHGSKGEEMHKPAFSIMPGRESCRYPSGRCLVGV